MSSVFRTAIGGVGGVALLSLDAIYYTAARFKDVIGITFCPDFGVVRVGDLIDVKEMF